MGFEWWITSSADLFQLPVLIQSPQELVSSINAFPGTVYVYAAHRSPRLCLTRVTKPNEVGDKLNPRSKASSGEWRERADVSV